MTTLDDLRQAIRLMSPAGAHTIALSFAACYVGSLYVSNKARLKFEVQAKNPDNPRQERPRLAHERWRDDPDVIRARLLAVTIASVLSCLGVLALVWLRIEGVGAFETLALTSDYLGLDWSPWKLTARSILQHLVVPILFLGPLYATYLNQTLPFQAFWDYDEYVLRKYFSFMGLRTYIIGPITEEITFRACVLAVFHMGGVSRKQMIFLSPLTFGVAHVHHAWDTYNRYGRNLDALKRALIGSSFQLFYTSVFGFLVAYVFVRTQSLAAPITAHIFCNTMGFPDLLTELRMNPRHRKSIVAAYIIGIAGFVYTLPRWTQ
ncbi:Abi-domain-containing protein [Coprinopsis marcescibilis]|uniref:intramembrane prenyl-peptidase Rce1 n=1 Tax=Coprinopsis marcescibilis TaxID=230819 RepID=A0A5C3KQB9_COPMA|nr:Abi-domain-containing protein [Coprinopsis marcescibilis]